MSDPVAVEFSLNTQMFLLSKRTLWLSDGSMGFGQESDVAFSEGLLYFFTSVSRAGLDVLCTQVKSGFLFNPGDTVYGRVMVDPVQNLGDSFFCSIEKVFLCTGTDGYVPKYNPTKFEFGCLADSPTLLYRFKILVSSLALFSFVLAFADACKPSSYRKKRFTSLLPSLDLMFITRTRLSQRPRPVLLEMSVLMLRWR